MRKFRKTIISFASFLILLLGASAMSVSATETPCQHGYLTFNDHQLVGGVGNYGNYRRYSYIYPSASSYSQIVQTALSQWTNTSVYTSISLRTTSVKSQSYFDIISYPESIDGSTVLAETFQYTYAKSNGRKNPMIENWGWSEIELYDIALNGDPGQYGSTYNQKLKTVAHEFGHAMGLSHADDPGKLMAQSWRGGTVTRATNYELYTINHIYG